MAAQSTRASFHRKTSRAAVASRRQTSAAIRHADRPGRSYLQVEQRFGFLTGFGIDDAISSVLAEQYLFAVVGEGIAVDLFQYQFLFAFFQIVAKQGLAFFIVAQVKYGIFLRVQVAKSARRDGQRQDALYTKPSICRSTCTGSSGLVSFLFLSLSGKVSWSFCGANGEGMPGLRVAI